MITYSAAHKRLRESRGPATDHACACGKPAQDWALTTVAPVVLDAEGRTYSLDPADYTPMCRPCHMQVDLARDTCRRGHPLKGGNLIESHPRRACATCKREHDELVRRAARALGMTKREFIAMHGSRRGVAEAVVAP